MGSHDPFGYLKYKLWPKEGPGVKLPIWLLTSKSQESPKLLACRWRATYCWKTLDKNYNFVLYLTLIGGFHKKVMGFQSCENPHFKNFGTPNLGVPWQNDIWVQGLWLGIENTIRGKVVTSPKSGPWWILWVHVYPSNLAHDANIL